MFSKLTGGSSPGWSILLTSGFMVESSMATASSSEGAYFLVAYVLSTTICQLKLNWKGGTFKESFYPACGHPVEDLYHIDVQCPPAKQLILEGGAYNHRFTGCKLPDPHPASWTCDLLSAKVCSQADAALIISGTWSLWNGRNYRKHALRDPTRLPCDRHQAHGKINVCRVLSFGTRQMLRQGVGRHRSI